jgi:phage I-like protein
MKQQERDSKKRIAFPIQLFAEGSADVQIPDVIQVVPVGKWDHPGYGEMEITSAHIAEFAQNFKDKVRLDIPINAGYDNGMSGGELPAIGWFTDVEDRGVNGLWAGVKWTDEGKRLLQERAFKYFSPEFYTDYEDPETRTKHGHVLIGGALTNKPYFKELQAVVSFSEPSIIHQFSEDMNLKDILSKKPEELSAEEKAFVRANQAELTDEQKTEFAAVVEAPAEPETPAATPDTPETPAPATPEVTASETGKVITMSAAEAAALRDQANKGAQAFAEVEKMKLEKNVAEKLVFSASNPEGRILPKNKDAVVAFRHGFQ